MATMLAKHFIQRRDVKAVQYPSGAYAPIREPFTMKDLHDHLNGTYTYGHYMIDQNDNCRLFAFDIDLEQTGAWPEFPTFEDPNTTDADVPLAIHQFDPRASWADRSHPSRDWIKSQMRSISYIISSTVERHLGVQTVTAYSGSKGVHVYALTGVISASEAHEAATLTMELTQRFEPSRGKNFFRSIDQDPYTGFPNFSIEIYPKQASLEGKDLGNLMRLPLGRNLKSADPTFFINQSLTPSTVLAPHQDPVALLEDGMTWK